jgi:pyruvate/2-oxoglutarate dehydrogenase complex dihydrolipoamide acyltransferase (E2) component
MPHLSPGKNQAAVYLDQRLRLEKTLAWLKAQNQGRAPKDQIKFFHLVLCALARVLHQRPRLNRFTVGGRIYQRRQVSVSFAVKPSFDDQTEINTVRVVFDPDESAEQVSRKLKRVVRRGRGPEKTQAQREMDVISHLPPSMIGALVRLHAFLDARNLLPAALLREDPLYASLFVANMGSLGMDAPFHHLYEYGTVPIFATVGRIHQAPVVDQGQLAVGTVAHIRYTFDERIADGFYCAQSLELVRQWIEDPELLDASS